MRVYSHPACLGHDTGAGHAERPERLSAVCDALRVAYGERLDWHEAPGATRGQLLRVHAPELLAAVLETRPAHLLLLDPDTLLSPGSDIAALRAAGAVVAAVDAACGGLARRVFCAVRPPGHHAERGTAMGFCLFNNVAVGAAHALEAHGIERVAIIDFDVHHGNGTQAIFAADARVQYLSTHQAPLYPGTGAANERGLGNVHNLPLPPGAGSEAFRAAWSMLLPAIDAFRPRLVLVSAGFVAHASDPLAQLQLQADDYAWITRELASIADRHAGGRLVSALEGGYDLDALAQSAVAHVGAMLEGAR